MVPDEGIRRGVRTAMTAHSKPRAIATTDGLFILGPDGFYSPHNSEEHYRHRRTIWLAMLLGSWIFVYGLYLAAQAWLG